MKPTSVHTSIIDLQQLFDKFMPLTKQLVKITAVALLVLIALSLQLSISHIIALSISALILVTWSVNRISGFIAALMFIFTKGFLLRASYALDTHFALSSSFDLLGITPPLLIVALIAHTLLDNYNHLKHIIRMKTVIYLLLFSSVAFLSILNPKNSIILGLAGFERNILPNMFIMLLSAILFTNKSHLRQFSSALIMFMIVANLYAIGQFFAGLYPWEIKWMSDIVVSQSTSGWLTIGLRGIEFRLFSTFYNYMDFTFVNVIVFALALSYKNYAKPLWSKLRIIYIVSWSLVLILSLERMPLIMSMVILFVHIYLNSTNRKRKYLRITAIITTLVLIFGLQLAKPVFVNTGADKLVRLAELANPLAASSIQDRVERKWQPTFEIITANLLGVGIGYGSQTKASAIAEDSGYLIEPHNEILQKTMETGLVGGTLFLLLLISIFSDSRALLKENKTKRFAVAMIGITISFWVCGMVNLPFSGASGLLYWTLAGITLGFLYNHYQTKKDNTMVGK